MLISSALTPWLRGVMPVAWFVLLAAGATAAALDAGRPLLLPLPFAGVAVIGWLVFRTFLAGLADAVEDHGDHLVVRRGGREARIDLAAIDNVGVSTMQNPPRITLLVRGGTPWGDEVSFLAPMHWRIAVVPRCAVADDLIRRVVAARGR